MTKAVKGFVKSVPLVWGLAVRLLVVPGVIRASVGVDCLVPCPPSVAPRTLNPLRAQMRGGFSGRSLPWTPAQSREWAHRGLGLGVIGFRGRRVHGCVKEGGIEFRD